MDYRRAEVGSGAFTLPGRYYTAPEVFTAETERLFCGGWYFAARAEEIPEHGDFLNVTIGEESIILVRDGEAIRGLFNVCRHRGSRMCEEERGHFSDCIRCPYHAWAYGLDGRLLAARHMQELPGFDRADYPLVSAAVAEWDGFLLVNLSENPEPFEKAFAPLLGRFRAWNIGDLRRGAQADYEIQANWKLIIENYSECYHCNLVHPELVRLSPADSGRNDLSEGPFLGGYMDLNDACGTMTETGRSPRPPLPGVEGEERKRVYYYALFPNLLLSLHPDYVMAHFLQPLAPDRTHITCEWYFHPETMQRPDFDPQDAVRFWDRVNRQDWRVCELSQQGVSSRAYRPGPYANQEGLLWAFDREYLRRLGEV